ncbi:MAG: hypothetical protein AAF713_15385 [Pseudomonadota bacterium]
MGLGVSLIAEPPRSGILARKRFHLAELLEVFQGVLHLPAPLDRLARFTVGESAARAHLTPLEAPVTFRIDDRGRLLVTAPTQMTGPGYHQQVVSGLTELARHQRFYWDESGNASDPASYFADRDFPSLQREFAWDLARLSRRLMREAGGVDIGLPDDLVPLDTPCFARTQRGPRDRQFFEEAANPDTAEQSAADHFPWWDSGLTGRTALGMAEALAWSVFPWRAGLYDSERVVGEVISELATKTRGEEDLDGRLGLSELTEILAAEMDLGPQPDGPGFLRGRVLRPLTGGWKIALPGHFTSRFDSKTSCVSYWFKDREVHATTYAAHERELNLEAEADAAMGEISEMRDEHLFVADFGAARGQDWEAVELEGRVRTPGGLAIVSILVEGDADRDWALDTFRSIRFDQGGQQHPERQAASF